MAVLPIETLGSDVLRRPASEVVEIDESLRILADDMFETMYAAEGIGLAAPQVGVSRRLIVVDIHQDESEPFALINPRVVEAGSGTDRLEEGCLSIPGVSATVERAERVVVEGLDLEGHPLRMEVDGLLARCLQHEIDHLDGVLFIDRISPLKRRIVLQKYRRLAQADDRGSPAEAKRSAKGR
jgi:peptide deformylase